MMLHRRIYRMPICSTHTQHSFATVCAGRGDPTSAFEEFLRGWETEPMLRKH